MKYLNERVSCSENQVVIKKRDAHELSKKLLHPIIYIVLIQFIEKGSIRRR
ncbi:hypothetical protein FHW88_003668 [Mucilaginibacter sp. SG538B]|nr:hypothetical protein [Mucilaginibacter sp. SG538B]